MQNSNTTETPSAQDQRGSLDVVAGSDSLADQLARAKDEYRNLNAAYQQLADLYAEAEEDANRYRFLRLNWDEWTGKSWSGTREEIARKLDEAISNVATLDTGNPNNSDVGPAGAGATQQEK